MKILHIDNYYLPWLGYEAELARAQQSAEHDVWFAASNRIPGEKAGTPRPTHQDETPVHAVLLRPLAVGQRIIFLPGIVGVLLRFRPQVVHCHSIFDLTAVILALCKPLLRYRLIYCSHTSDVNTDSRSTWLKRAAYRSFRVAFGWLLRAAADHIVAVGEHEKAMVVRELSLEPEKVSMLRLGAPLADLEFDEAARGRERTRLGFGDVDVVLLHTGTLTPRKRLHDLIEAVARLHSLNGSIKLLIVGGGDPEYVEATQVLARTYGLEGHTVITGRFVDKLELFRYYAAADIGVWPGDYSIATLEAMASGLPLIVRANDAYTEFLTSSDNGLRFFEGDVESLAACIAELAQDRHRRMDMGEASRELAAAEFDWSAIAEKFLELYRAVPSGSSREAISSKSRRSSPH